jgi:hypothetical protein
MAVGVIGSIRSSGLKVIAKWPESQVLFEKFALPAGGKATPTTYLGADGRQYVVIAAGGDGKAWGWSDEIIAFALPRSAR